MKRLSVLLVTVMIGAGAVAQTNMKAFRHMSFGAEAGLHGLGVELALPVEKHLVFKAGYNWSPSGDLFNSDFNISTSELKNAQEEIERKSLATGSPVTFTNRFQEESTIHAGLSMGLHNFKAMVNFYPFSSRFYLAGGVYYSAKGFQDESLITVNGRTTANDWAALQELRQTAKNMHNQYPALFPQTDYDIEIEMGGTKYKVNEVDACGHMQADFKFDPLKYYVGAGLGRCIPNGAMGLQLEVGAMIYHNSVLTFQGQELNSLSEALEGNLSGDAKEMIEYADKYPIYPQVTLRISFRLF